MSNDPLVEQEISQINMTPFVDIVLVLLIVFMATANFITQHALELQLPEAQTAAVLSQDDPHITISITDAGRIFLNGTMVDKARLAAALKLRDRETPVLVRSDRQARYGTVIEVVDLCKAQGYGTFALESRND